MTAFFFVDDLFELVFGPLQENIEGNRFCRRICIAGTRYTSRSVDLALSYGRQ